MAPSTPKIYPRAAIENKVTFVINGHRVPTGDRGSLAAQTGESLSQDPGFNSVLVLKFSQPKIGVFLVDMSNQPSGTLSPLDVFRQGLKVLQGVRRSPNLSRIRT